MDVQFYRDARGNSPVEKYLDGLDRKMRTKTMRSISLLKEYGPLLREPESKPLGDGIFELRSAFGGDAGRVLYFFFHGDVAVLTHGFMKKTRKTPRGEIDRARRCRADYLSRHGCGLHALMEDCHG